MSKTFFTENAYNVLGLDSSASEKEILKRSREIENLLKIDEIPEYELDLPFSKEVRTETKVKKAAERLTTPDKKIIETFFWFFIKDNTDEKALKLFKDGDYVGALETLQSKVTASPNSFTAVRNKAVLESLIFTEKAQNKYLEASLKSWQTILISDKQWADFKKVYRLNNPDVSDTLFENFKKNAEKILAGFYESMSKTADKPEIYAAYSKRFSAHSDSFDKDTLDPLLNKLNACTEKIHRYTIEFDTNDYQTKKWLSEKSRDKITDLKDEADAITDEIQALGKGVWDNSKTKVVRDKNAAALRGLAIDIVNNSDVFDCPEDKELADEVLETAYNICSDDSATEKRIEKDQKDFGGLESAKLFKEKFDSVTRHIEARRFNLAVSEIDELLAMDDIPEETKANLRSIRYKCSNASTYASSSYVGRTGGGGWGWLGWLIVAIICGIIWFAIHQSNQNKLNDTLNICSKKGISSSECKSSQSKNGVTCKDSGLYVECKKK